MKNKRRRERPNDAAQIGLRDIAELDAFANRQQKDAPVPQQRRQRRRQNNSAEKRLMARPPQPLHIIAIRAHETGRNRRDGDDNAQPKQIRRHIKISPQRRPGERRRRQPAQHHHIGRHHQGERQIGDAYRPRQHKSGAHLAPQPGAGDGAFTAIVCAARHGIPSRKMLSAAAHPGRACYRKPPTSPNRAPSPPPLSRTGEGSRIQPLSLSGEGQG